MRRWVFDIDPKKEEWIRLRDNGKTVTIAYKCKSGSNVAGTEEIEIEVDDFEKTKEILSKILKENQYYQENKRITFHLKDLEFTIDTRPRIPSFLEIEAESEEKVIESNRRT